MPTDDPFFNDDDADRTIIRPMPGGAQRGQPIEPRDPPAAPAPAPRTAPVPEPKRSTGRGDIGGRASFEAMLGRGINPLLDAASPLLILATQLRNTASHNDVAGLRSSAVQMIRNYESTALERGYDREVVLRGRYILCVFVDEAVLGMPWGGDSIWGAESLLSTFHDDVWGGEKFFVLLDRLIQQPANNIDMLELMYSCLALGFRGKYGVAQMGLSQLSEVQGDVYRAIVNQRGDFERELSPRWQGVADKRNALERYVPLWVVGALSGVLLLVLFAGFRMILGDTSDPIVDGLEEISHGTAAIVTTENNEQP